MIEARELRYGNLVTCLGKEVELIGISKWNGNNYTTLHYAEFKGMIPIQLFHLKPIPLTEEWLLKFGFVYTDDVDNLNRDYKLQEFEIQLHLDVNDFVCCNTIPNYVQIKHVHQLQNLYFDFTDEELTRTK